MRRCLHCEQRFAGPDWRCPRCGWSPELRDGIAVLAPRLADGGGPFDRATFARLAEAERDHFWFIARRRLIAWAIARYFPEAVHLLEVGCGTGNVIGALAAASPRRRCWATDARLEGLAHARARWGKAVSLVQCDATDLPFDGEFDLIGAFDVVEHIEDDEQAIRQAHRALRPGGGLVLTAPQHPWLWSATDAAAGHVRRYRAADLRRLVESAGFVVVRSTSFVSLLLPLMMAARGGWRRTPRIEDELAVPAAVGRLCAWAMAAEAGLIRGGIDLPVGGSRLVVARRP
jgi:ubiquinone/menaquinone biosynthesis C-methylase UbiE